MPPKNSGGGSGSGGAKKSKSGGKGGGGFVASDANEGMQALILADLFDSPGLAPLDEHVPAVSFEFYPA